MRATLEQAAGGTPVVDLVAHVSDLPRLADEPPFHGATATVTHGVREFGVATSQSRTTARQRAIAEAVERYALHQPAGAASTSRSTGRLDLGQIYTYGERRGTPDVDQWTAAYDLYTGDRIDVPTALAYFATGPSVRFPISTGAAAGSTVDGAALRGLLEVIERSVFMRAWLARRWGTRTGEASLHPPTREMLERYRLEPLIFGLPNPFGVVVVLAVIFDDSGVGPALTAGAAAALETDHAVRHALEEALQIRSWIRRHWVVTGVKSWPETVQSALERALYWSHPGRASELRKSLIANSTAGELAPEVDHPTGLAAIAVIAHKLRLRGSVPLLKVLGRYGLYGRRAWVVRAMVPDLEPLYQDDADGPDESPTHFLA